MKYNVEFKILEYFEGLECDDNMNMSEIKEHFINNYIDYIANLLASGDFEPIINITLCENKDDE